MAQQPQRLDGINPLAYLGTNPYTPPGMYGYQRNPTPNDYQGFLIGDFWINRSTPSLWYLANKSVGGLPVSQWIMLGGGGGSGILTITGNTGGAVPGDGMQNIDLLGLAPYTVTGNIVTNTLSISDNGTVALGFLLDDSNIVSPISNILTLSGSPNIMTYEVALGDAGFKLINFTNHALPVGNAAGGLTSLAAATNGQIPIGSIGANPVLATITAGANITVTNGAGSITIASTGGAGTLSTLTANSGGAVSPLAGNINVFGDTTTINIVGNPGTHTLTASTTGVVATSYVTDAGTAVPVAGVLHVNGAAGITTSGAGNVVTITGSGGGGGTKVTTFLTSGMWTKDVNAKMVQLIICSGGGGGGSGQSADASVFSGIQGGAGGGAGSMLTTVPKPAFVFGATETVIVGTGGIGGAAVVGIQGNTGGEGGTSSFGNFVGLLGGHGGVRGSGFAQVNRVNTIFVNDTISMVGALAGGDPTGAGPGQIGISAENLPTTVTNPVGGGWLQTSFPYLSPTGGGGGAKPGNPGLPTWNGGSGGFILTFAGGIIVNGGTFGFSGSENGGNGNPQATTGGVYCGGTGGGGGAWTWIGRVAGRGGNGGFPGGGGGGGTGSGFGANASGAGGNGANGLVTVIEYL